MIVRIGGCHVLMIVCVDGCLLTLQRVILENCELCNIFTVHKRRFGCWRICTNCINLCQIVLVGCIEIIRVLLSCIDIDATSVIVASND